ncbi:elongation factor Ts [Skermanella sp. TT6]|uniref:Elongation factor Ts n=1 Tax=Skermanella cutis TaxID=2775420 RepID=A0ABX7BCI6_9PROT|nr:translation elongation factor Ts [Skermanella sp. TT6]QQP92109.1 elongation factor Ts [Skermanella sp. TT6]
MAEITASLVKELREKTGAGMMDCKKALTETSGDLEGAVDWLRKKGLAAAAKKAGRVAAEGLVAVATADTVGAAVEVNSETDFVARNDRFQAFANQVAQLALQGDGTIESLQQQAFPGTDRNVADEVTNMVATIGENMNLRRVSRIAVEQGAVASYVHNALAPNLGKIGVLVGLESTGDRARLLELGKQIAMHIAAARPEAVNIEDVDASSLERERSVLADQARASGKPEDIIAKMVEGRLRKYYEEVVLLEQVYVIDGENKVRKVVEAVAKEIGAPIKVVGFTRFVLGEGIEKEQSDFAAEVAAQANVGR